MLIWKHFILNTLTPPLSKATPQSRRQNGTSLRNSTVSFINDRHTEKVLREGFNQTLKRKTMTKQEKSDLIWKVRYYLGDGRADEYIIDKLTGEGFQKATIKKYIKACSK